MKNLSKRSLALVLAMLMMLSMMIVGAVSTANAATYGSDSVTFKAGETIYYDLTVYNSTTTQSNKGANIYSASGVELDGWKQETSNIIPVTLTADLTITTESNLFKCADSNWQGVKATALPTEGQNMIVSEDGKTAYWATYVEPEKESYTIYFKDTLGWGSAYAHFYADGYSISGNGCTGTGAALNVDMTKVADNVYSATFDAPQAYKKVCFTKDQQNDYNNFWQTEASYRTDLDFASGKTMFVPETTVTSTMNQNVKYYNDGQWVAYGTDVPETTTAPETDPVVTEPVATDPVTTDPATTEPTGETRIIKFTDNQGWGETGTIYAYFFDNEGTTVGPEYPGTEMKAFEDNGMGQKNYSVEVPEGAAFVIFNVKYSNGSSDQTENITLGGFEGYCTDGKRDAEGHLEAYGWNTEDTPEEPSSTEATEPATTEPTGETRIIKFTDNQAWGAQNGTVYAYFFNKDGTVGPTWHGTKMDGPEDNGTGQINYSVKVPEGATSVIFNVKYNDGKSDQTVDIDLTTDDFDGYYTDGRRDELGHLEVIGWNTSEPEEPSTTAPATTEPATTEPATTEPAAVDYSKYCLVGNIDGKNVGCDDDYQTVPEGNLFAADGTKTFTFAKDSYVFVKTKDSQNWFMTDGWLGNVTSATLYNTTKLGTTANKLMVPAGVVKFTLVENADGTLTLSYVPVETEYTVVYNYTTNDGEQTLTKTVKTNKTDATAIASLAVPEIVNPYATYALGECTLNGTTVNATMVATPKEYTVTVDGKEVGKYGYKEMATVTLDGAEYSFYVTGDVELVSGAEKEAAAISLDGLTVSDTKVSMELLATANVDNFARMGVVFATSEKSQADIEAAVAAVTTGTKVSNGIAVHNSSVNKPNQSGSYQFTYAPFVKKEQADKTLYFYTFAVDTNGKVSVSSAAKVDLANAVA